VIVTATRTLQRIDETLASVIVIPREDIERSQAMDVAELLRFHSGLEIARNGGPGQATSLFIRGTESNHALVMVDGVPINPGTIGGAALQHIQPELIERIEVVKGPLSTLYGSDAIGGVVNIITRRLEEGLQVQASVEAGSYDTRTLSATVQAAGAGGRAGAMVSRFDTEGFPTREGSEIDQGYDNRSLNAYAGTDLGPIEVEASHWQAQGRVEYLGFLLEPQDQDFRNSVSVLTLRARPAQLWTSTLKLSHMIDEIDQNQSRDFAHTRRNMLDWQNDVGLGEHHLVTAGLVLSREHTESLVLSGPGFDVDTTVNAVYLQDNAEYGDHGVQLAWRMTDHESFGRHHTWNLAYGFQATSRTRLLASLGTAFRAPDSTDRFGFGGNPDLEPETSHNVELGVRHQIDPQQSVALSAFQNRIDNLIVFTVSEAPQGRVENIGRARIRGLEAEYEGRWGPWQARLSALIQDPKDLDTGELLPRRARRSLTALLAYATERYALSADFLAQSRRKDSNFSDEFMAGYGLVNLTGQVHLGKGWTLQGRIENLFDKDYELAAGFNTPERSYVVGLRYALK
jgi:vitamin B12 transporter